MSISSFVFVNCEPLAEAIVAALGFARLADRQARRRSPLLVCLNGFFVAAEFALVKIRSSQLEALAAEGNKRAADRAARDRQSGRLSFRLSARHYAGEPRPRLGRRAISRAHAAAGVCARRDSIRRGDYVHLVHARLFRDHFPPHRARRTGAENSRDPQSPADDLVGQSARFVSFT